MQDRWKRGSRGNIYFQKMSCKKFCKKILWSQALQMHFMAHENLRKSRFPGVVKLNCEKFYFWNICIFYNYLKKLKYVCSFLIDCCNLNMASEFDSSFRLFKVRDKLNFFSWVMQEKIFILVWPKIWDPLFFPLLTIIKECRKFFFPQNMIVGEKSMN